MIRRARTALRGAGHHHRLRARAHPQHNDRNGFTLPFRPNLRGVSHFAMKPGWLARVVLPYALRGQLPRHENYPPQYQQTFRLRAGGGEPQRFEAMTWDDVARIRDAWPRKLIIKSVLTAHDAEMAVKHGADGIVISNHGGRALDSARPTIDALPEIAAAVGHKTTVMLDSGVRRGADIAKSPRSARKRCLSAGRHFMASALAGRPARNAPSAFFAMSSRRRWAILAAGRWLNSTPDTVVRARRPDNGAQAARRFMHRLRNNDTPAKNNTTETPTKTPRSIT